MQLVEPRKHFLIKVRGCGRMPEAVYDVDDSVAKEPDKIVPLVRYRVHPEALWTLYDLFFFFSQGGSGQGLAGAQADGAPILAKPVESSV